MNQQAGTNKKQAWFQATSNGSLMSRSAFGSPQQLATRFFNMKRPAASNKPGAIKQPGALR